jgi:zinc-ribbon domain
MVSSKCRECGSQLLPETNFCRQCGTRITADLPVQNDPATKLFTDEDIVATQQFDSRPTSPNRTPVAAPLPVPENGPRKRSGKLMFLGALLLILLAGLVTTVAIMRTHMRHVGSDESVIYPGARKTLDIVAEGGGRAVQLETSDSLEQVDEWYRETLKPDKAIRLSATSVVLKNEKTVATIVREGNQTNILIKMNPR